MKRPPDGARTAAWLGRRFRRRARGGFTLLEAMLAVGIFAIGVLALGKCVSSCVAAEHFKQEDSLARRALQNRMAEIEAGAVTMGVSSGSGGVNSATTSEELKPPFDGMKMKVTTTPLKKKNEDGKDLAGINMVTLEVSWKSGAEMQTKELTFYVAPRQR